MDDHRMPGILANNLLSAAQHMLSIAGKDVDQQLVDLQLEQMFEDNRDAATSLLQTSTAEEIDSLHRLGVAFRLCSNYSMAELFYARALDLSTELFGADSSQTAKHRNFLAGLYFAAGRFEYCRAHLLTSLRAYEMSLGPAHLYCQLTRFALALTYSALGDRDNATRYYAGTRLKDLSVQLNKANPSDSWSSLLPKIVGMAAIKYEQGQFLESVELFKFCVLQEANEAWPANLVVARTLENLGTLCRSQGLERESDDFIDIAQQMRHAIAQSKT